VLIAYQMIRLLKSDDSRWWLGIGAVIGVGMLTKYAMAYLVAGIVVGVLLTRARRYLASPWLWGGVGLALLIMLPNVIWQIQHDFISLQFLSSIHARDVRAGRSEGFLVEQLIFATNPVTIPLWVAGLCFYFFARTGRSYRLLGWMYLRCSSCWGCHLRRRRAFLNHAGRRAWSPTVSASRMKKPEIIRSSSSAGGRASRGPSCGSGCGRSVDPCADKASAHRSSVA
jgi:4-amino-4-deoxy-L-arabinose transferase-like glycosyltransferase